MLWRSQSTVGGDGVAEFAIRGSMVDPSTIILVV